MQIELTKEEIQAVIGMLDVAVKRAGCKWRSTRFPWR